MKKKLVLGFDPNGKPIFYEPEHAKYGLHILGRPGLGKSKFLELFVRRLILNHEGCVLIDPHGNLYDAIVKWSARYRLLDRDQVVLFEPGGSGWAFGFNPLNVQGLTPDEIAETVAALMKACAQVWGGEDLARTPRLSRCLPAVLHALCVRDLTLNESLILCDGSQESERKFLTSGLSDSLFRDEWAYLNGLGSRHFTEMMESTRSRLSAFLQAPIIRTIVSQQKATIDFSEIMAESKVVLIDLSKVPEAQKQLLGSLFVADIFRRCIQRPADVSPPFSVVIDEAHLFINSDIAKLIEQGRKFSTRVVISTQRLGQIREVSESLLESVMMIPNRICFGGLPVRDAREIAESMFMGKLDLEKPKTILDKPVVVEHRRVEMRSTSDTAGKSITDTKSESHGEQTSTSESETDTEGESDGEQSSTTLSRETTKGEAEAQTRSRSTAYSRSETDSESHSVHSSTSTGEAMSWSEGDDVAVVSLPNGEVLTVLTGSSSSVGGSDSSGFMEGETDTFGHSSGTTDTESEGEAETNTKSLSEAQGEAQTAGTSHTKTRSHARQRGSSRGRSSEQGTSHAESSSRQHTDGKSETFEPILKVMHTATYTLEELFYLATSWIVDQKKRFAFLRLEDHRLVQIKIPFVKPIRVNQKRLERAKQAAHQRSPWAIPDSEAQKELEGRREALQLEAREASKPKEIKSFSCKPKPRRKV